MNSGITKTGSKRKVFITGISSELMQSVVSLIDVSEYDIKGLILPVESISIPGIELIKGDIRDPGTYREQISGSDIIIHAAAITHSFHEEPYYEVNYKATKTLVDLAVDLKVGHFVFISSRAAGEDAGAYGQSKLLAEHYIREKLKNWTILRPSEIFGGSKNEGIEKVLKDASKKRLMFYPASIASDMYPLHMSDTAALIYRFGLLENHSNSTLILNGPVGYSYRDLISLAGKLKGKRIITFPIPKALLYLAKYVFKFLSVNFGFVPDQVDRLYSPKNTAKIDHDFYSLERYISEKL